MGSPRESKNKDLKMVVPPPHGDLMKGGVKQPLSPKEGKSSKSKDIDSRPIDQSHGEGDENDSFHRLYNKEIKVNQDEIPLLLMELTDIAYKFIKKDQFEKAYVLL